MSQRQLDVIFVSPNSAKEVYQELYHRWTAIEPPFWSAMLSQSCRAKGFGVSILDCLAENLTPEQAVQRIKDENPRLVCFVTYGANPNAGTTQMVGTLKVAKLLKESYPEFKTMSIGSHTSALPHEVLNYSCFDFISYNEGVKCLHSLLAGDLETDLDKVPALGWKKDGLNKLNSGANSLVTTKEMDHLLPGSAWDLLPYDKKPLDLYRSHTWLASYLEEHRTPYAALYSSLSCRFSCDFCMINVVSRTDPSDGIYASHSNEMRFWSPEFILKEFETLIEKYGCTTIRILDELFFFDKRYYEPILKGIVERGYGKLLRTWTYARVDTINERFLDLFSSAGVKYLGIGIEASQQHIRQEITKGKFKDVNIRDVVQKIKNHGMYAGNNFIFGHWGEKMEDMQATLDLSLELLGEFSNFYAVQPLPGSELYYKYLNRGWKPPANFEAYSFHSYETQSVPTQYLTAEEVLRFRDRAWLTYFTNPAYHKLVLEKFGQVALDNIIEQTKMPLKRKILGD